MSCLVGYVQAGEPGGEVIPGGQCSACGHNEHKADERRRIRNLRDVQRWAREPHEVKKMTDEDWRRLTGVAGTGDGPATGPAQGGK